jgi:HlyD family secretion protein
MSDSRELLEAKTHPVIAIFLALLGVILSAALAWSYFGNIDIVVKAQGVVRPNEKVSTVRNKVLGKVEAVSYKSGDNVQEGQVLLTIASHELELERRTVIAELGRVKDELAALERLREELIQKGNSSESGTDWLESLQELPTKQRLSLQVKTAEQKINHLQHKIQNDEKLERSIIQGQNLFADSDSEYFNKYKDYELNVGKLKLQKQKVAEEYRQLVIIHGDKPLLSKPGDEIAITLDNYTNEYLLKLRVALSEQRKQMEELRLAMAQSYVELNSAVQTSRDQIRKLENRLNELEVSRQDRVIAAPITGTVNLLMDVNKGDLLQSGAEVMTIVPENSTTYTVQLMLQNKDIADIREGDRIKYHFNALPYKEYGELYGYIRKISADATVNRESGESYYIAEADIDNRPLYNKKGEQGVVKVGMVSEAYVVTRSEKILFFLLRKIDLKE